MPFPLFQPSPRHTIGALYGVIVAQARLPAFYLAYGVADTVSGRFELVVLHTVLLLHRLGGEPALQSLGQGSSMNSAATWITICAKWASVTPRCRAR